MKRNLLVRVPLCGMVARFGRRRDFGSAHVLMFLLFTWSLLFASTNLALAQTAPAPSPAPGSALPSDLPEVQRRIKALVTYTQAMEAITNNQDFRAIDLLKQVVDLDPTSSIPHETLGEIYYSRRNTVEAKREAELAVKLDPKSAGGHKLLGRLQRDEALSTSDKALARKAIDEFKQVVAADDTEIEAWQSLASLYGLTDEREEQVQALRRWTSNDPSADQALYQLALLHFDKREYRLAAENAAQALAARPSSEAATLLARSLLALGQARAALQTYRDAMARDPKSTELQISYSEALIYAGQYDDALEALKKLKETDPNNLEAIRLTTQAQRRSGRRKEAIDTLKGALKGRDVSESMDLQVALAETYEELGQADDAVKSYDEVLGSLLNPDGTLAERFRRPVEDILVREALVYRQARRHDDMARTIERMRQILGPKTTRPDLILIDSLREEQRYVEMLQRADDAAKRYPDEQDFRLLKAQALGHLDRVDEAMRVLDSTPNNSPDDLQVLSTKAQILYEADRHRQAETVLQDALRRDPKNNQLLVQLSMVQDKLGRAADAEATLRTILEQDPDNPTALNNLGYYLAERGERLEEALQLTQRAVNIAPTNGSFLDSLGWVYYQMGRLNEAQRYLEQAINGQPNDGTVHEHMGDVYKKQGRLDQARRSWERSLQLAKEKTDRARIQKKLDDLLAAKAKD